MGEVHALSKRYGSIVKCVESEVVLENTYTGQKLPVMAIWDTGAEVSCITKEAAEKLGLNKIKDALIAGVKGGDELTKVYSVRITLNNESISLIRNVYEADDFSHLPNRGLLIGMDIISLGDFAISNYDGKTVMTFRVPSMQKIDFVDGIKNGKQIITGKLPSRNAPCPCGSGKKYKHCCGKE